MINWHRIFGLGLQDYFLDKPYDVELEKDLSLNQQFLDVVIVRNEEEDREVEELCDGLEFLKKHNLLTFKTHHESFGEAAVFELLGHYSKYCKMTGIASKIGGEVQLFAVVARYPRKLFATEAVETIKHGVYRLRLLRTHIIVIVTSRIDKSKANALWNLYSFNKELAAYGMRHYGWLGRKFSSVIDQLYIFFEREGWYMPYTIDDFRREHIKTYSYEERLEGIPYEKRLAGIPVKKRFEGIDPERRLDGLSEDEIQALLKRYIKSDD